MRSADERALLKEIPKDKSVYKPSLKEKLGWSEERVDSTVQSLVKKGILKAAKGLKQIERNPYYFDNLMKYFGRIAFFVVFPAITILVLLFSARETSISGFIQSYPWIFYVLATIGISSASEDYYLKEVGKSSLRSSYLSNAGEIHGKTVSDVALRSIFGKEAFIRENGKSVPKIASKILIKVKFWSLIFPVTIICFLILFFFGGMALSFEKTNHFLRYFFLGYAATVWIISKVSKFLSSHRECYLFDGENWVYITAEAGEHGLYNRSSNVEILDGQPSAFVRFLRSFK